MRRLFWCCRVFSGSGVVLFFHDSPPKKTLECCVFPHDCRVFPHDCRVFAHGQLSQNQCRMFSGMPRVLVNAACFLECLWNYCYLEFPPKFLQQDSLGITSSLGLLMILKYASRSLKSVELAPEWRHLSTKYKRSRYMLIIIRALYYKGSKRKTKHWSLPTWAHGSWARCSRSSKTYLMISLNSMENPQDEIFTSPQKQQTTPIAGGVQILGWIYRMAPDGFCWATR